MLPQEKLNVQDFRNVILSGILADLLHIQIEINIAIFSNQIIEWFSSCYRVPSIVGVHVVQEKFGNLRNTNLGILEDFFHYIDAIIKLSAKKK